SKPVAARSRSLPTERDVCFGSSADLTPSRRPSPLHSSKRTWESGHGRVALKRPLLRVRWRSNRHAHGEIDRAIPGVTPDRPKLANRSHLTLRFPADVFPRFSSISYSTCCPSLSVLSPARSTAEM